MCFLFGNSNRLRCIFTVHFLRPAKVSFSEMYSIAVKAFKLGRFKVHFNNSKMEISHLQSGDLLSVTCKASCSLTWWSPFPWRRCSRLRAAKESTWLCCGCCWGGLQSRSELESEMLSDITVRPSSSRVSVLTWKNVETTVTYCTLCVITLCVTVRYALLRWRSVVTCHNCDCMCTINW